MCQFLKENATQAYNDLDLIFGVDLSSARTYDRIKTAVLDSLLDFLPAGVSRTRMLSCSLKEAYVSKMVKVTEGDRYVWQPVDSNWERGRGGGGGGGASHNTCSCLLLFIVIVVVIAVVVVFGVVGTRARGFDDVAGQMLTKGNEMS